MIFFQEKSFLFRILVVFTYLFCFSEGSSEEARRQRQLERERLAEEERMNVERELRAQEARERQIIQEEAARQARRAARAEHVAAVVSRCQRLEEAWRRESGES